MSLYGQDQHPDEMLETRSADRVAFTQVGDWVLLADISATAKALYALLAAHVNVNDGQRKVWPSKETLAGWLGLKRAKSVSPYLDELIALGAITKDPQRTPGNLVTRNVYSVRWNPPVGLTTHSSFGDFYQERNAQRKASSGSVSAGRAVVPKKGPRAEQEEFPLDYEPAGRAVVPSEGPRSPAGGTVVVPCSAPELDQGELHEEAPLGPPAELPPEAETAIAVRRADRRRHDVAELNRTARSGQAQAIVDGWAQTCRRRPPRQVFTDLTVEVDRLLAEQWPPDLIRAALAKWSEAARSPRSLASFAHQIANQSAGPKSRTTAAMQSVDRAFDEYYARHPESRPVLTQQEA